MQVFLEHTREDIPAGLDAAVERAVRQAMTMEGMESGELSDDGTVQQLNREFRGIDATTDVLSFPANQLDEPIAQAIAHGLIPEPGEAEGAMALGDIIISVDRVKEQAESYGHSQKREFAFLVAHSMLHLCGYDHMEEDEAKVMEAKQEQVLASLGITRD